MVHAHFRLVQLVLHAMAHWTNPHCLQMGSAPVPVHTHRINKTHYKMAVLAHADSSKYMYMYFVVNTFVVQAFFDANYYIIFTRRYYSPPSTSKGEQLSGEAHMTGGSILLLWRSGKRFEREQLWLRMPLRAQGGGEVRL